jgi:hypothetical protein
MCCLLLAGLLVVPTANAKGKAQDATLVFYKEVPSAPATPFDQMEQHLEWELQRDYDKDNHPSGSVLHGLNVATGGTNRREYEEQELGRRLQDMESQKSQYLLALSQAGVRMQPCAGESSGSGCIKPAQSQYIVKIGKKSLLLLSPMQGGSKGNLYGLPIGTAVQIDVKREYVTIRVDGKDCQYNLLEAAW